MKHITLYLSIAFAFAVACDKTPVQDDNNAFVNFEDETFKAHCVSKFDKNEDGEISLEEAKEVKQIVVKRQAAFIPAITSLRGIEYFINLVYLDCSYNNLTCLDLSQNTALDILDCSNNPMLTSLDVSKNTALTRLYCYTARLTSLDVSKNTALEFLDCSWNLVLTGLDISKNTKLSFVNCSMNELTSLDISKNTALTDVSCSNNQLTSLNVGKNMVLEGLYCDSNQLTSLDVSGCPALNTLDCRDNPALSEIWLNSGQTIPDLMYDLSIATIKYKP